MSVWVDIDFFINIPLEEEMESDVFYTAYRGFGIDVGVSDNKQVIFNATHPAMTWKDFEHFVEGVTDLAGYDIAITKRAPEIAPCPNPECGSKCHCEHEGLSGEEEYTVTCNACGYYSSVASSEAEAIRLHNLISEKGIPKWIKAELQGIKHNLSNAMWVDACGNMETIAENVLYDINRIIAGKGK